MLTHRTHGPTPAGRFLVVYALPGVACLAVACDCSTPAQADDEAARLNTLQLRREEALRRECELCGLAGVYPDLLEVN